MVESGTCRYDFYDPLGTKSQKENAMNIGQKLNQIRKEKDLTLDQLAQMTGVAKATLSRIENSVVGGNLDTLKKITAALHVSLDSLITEGSTEMKMAEDDPKLMLAAVRKDLEVIAERIKKICKRLNIEPKGEGGQ